MKARRLCWMVLVAGLLTAQPDVLADAMGTAFTYQGRLEDGNGPVTDTCDFEFSLWDAGVAGTQKGDSPQSADGVDVKDGLFTLPIDFGVGAITGDARWLGIKVCCPRGSGFIVSVG